MIAIITDYLSGFLLLSGSFLCISGAVGLLRFPDFYTRMHAAGVTDTLTAGLLIGGLMLLADYWIVLVKLIFILLFLFLKRRYRHVDIVFIRHTHEAKEVDEETFFYSAETGGTVVSTALEEMRRIIADRYPEGDWNIYAAQASDGDNMSNDNAKSAALLENVILPLYHRDRTGWIWMMKEAISKIGPRFNRPMQSIVQFSIRSSQRARPRRPNEKSSSSVSSNRFFCASVSTL